MFTSYDSQIYILNCCFPHRLPSFDQLRIADLKVAAQKSLGLSFLHLIAPDGHVLDLQQSLEDEGLQEEDTCLGFALEFSVAWL